MEVDTDRSETILTPNSGEVIETEEEEILVYVNVDDGNDDFTAEDLENFKVIGLDTDEPIIQVGDKFFGGSWDEVVGTAVFFKETTHQPKRCYFSDDVPKPLKYIGKTQKSLNLKRAFITNVKHNTDEGKSDTIMDSVESVNQVDTGDEIQLIEIVEKEANSSETTPIDDVGEVTNENAAKIEMLY